MATQVITGTDFITVPTQDYEQAASFYGETLGLEFSKRWGSMTAGEFDDFEAAKAELESRGVEFEGDAIDSGVCFQAFFADPDGNALAIHHRYAPADAKLGG